MSIAREFPAEELEEIRQDWERTGHKLGMVAQLHGCKTERILKVLGMEAVEIKRKKPAQKTAWEKLNPEKAATFAELIRGGMNVKEACKVMGLKYDTGYRVWKRMKGKIDMSKANETYAPEMDAEPITPEDYEVETVESVESVETPAKAEKKDVCAVIFDQISAVTELVDLLDKNQMLSPEERELCDRFVDRADAFMRGIKYARKGQ